METEVVLPHGLEGREADTSRGMVSLALWQGAEDKGIPKKEGMGRNVSDFRGQHTAGVWRNVSGSGEFSIIMGVGRNVSKALASQGR